jgi:hypothetical protein
MDEGEQQHLIKLEITSCQTRKRSYGMENDNQVYALATIGYLDPHSQHPILDPRIPCIPVESHFMDSDSEGVVACEDYVHHGRIGGTRLAKSPGKNFSLKTLATAFDQADTFPRFWRRKRRIGPNSTGVRR